MNDKLLFTPGPLTTSQTVKQVMLHDLGSRDTDFIQVIRDIRSNLVRLCADPEEYTCILLPGSGTYGIEATISSVIPARGKLLVVINGAYGERISRIATIHQIPIHELIFTEDVQPDPGLVDEILADDPEITHVAVVHCETTTGIINPIDEIGEVVTRRGRAYIVDAMSSFGAYPIDMESSHIDYLVSSSNKCIEGVPGFSFVITRKELLNPNNGFARTLSLDLYAQWLGFEKNGQFRFTPPTHTILAFRQALLELEQEGGILARSKRYRQNHEVCLTEMQKMGFVPLIEEGKRSFIITSFRYPDHPNFNFYIFYERLREKGFVIYPGKLSQADCFRIGNIGRIDQEDMRALMEAIAITLGEMKIPVIEKDF